MYTIQIILELIKEHKSSQSELCRAIGASTGSFSDWKSHRSSPKQEYLVKIADFFGVTTDYLLTGDESKKYPATGNGSGISEHDKLAMELIKKYDGLSDDDKRAVERMIDALLESQENSQKK